MACELRIIGSDGDPFLGEYQKATRFGVLMDELEKVHIIAVACSNISLECQFSDIPMDEVTIRVDVRGSVPATETSLRRRYSVEGPSGLKAWDRSGHQSV